MGIQSARLLYQGKDHKDIYFQGKYHDKMYQGSELLWEKLRDKASWHRITAGPETFLAGNGMLLSTQTSRIRVSRDGVAWTDGALEKPPGLAPTLGSSWQAVYAGGYFYIICHRVLRDGNGITYFLPCVYKTSDGFSYELIDSFVFSGEGYSATVSPAGGSVYGMAVSDIGGGLFDVSFTYIFKEDFSPAAAWARFTTSDFITFRNISDSSPGSWPPESGGFRLLGDRYYGVLNVPQDGRNKYSVYSTEDFTRYEDVGTFGFSPDKTIYMDFLNSIFRIRDTHYSNLGYTAVYTDFRMEGNEMLAGLDKEMVFPYTQLYYIRDTRTFAGNDRYNCILGRFRERVSNMYYDRIVVADYGYGRILVDIDAHHLPNAAQVGFNVANVAVLGETAYVTAVSRGFYELWLCKIEMEG